MQQSPKAPFRPNIFRPFRRPFGRPSSLAVLSWERSLDEALTSGGREMRFGNNNFQHLLFQSRVLGYTHARSLPLSCLTLTHKHSL